MFVCSKIGVLFLIISCLSVFLAADGQATMVDVLWREFILKYNKNYATQAEADRR